MKNNHLADIDIQTFVLQKENCDIAIVEHIAQCDSCKMEVEQYKILFEEIKQQEQPIFDFDLSDLVMAQLPQPKPKHMFENTLIYSTVFATIIVMSIVFYFLRNNLLGMVKAITPIFIYLIITAALSLSIFLCIDMYTKFQKRMNALDF
ncbi:MAG: hypothetical protein HXX14_01070 [Bacteroidetes bacterium]|nr:hypothetical protein [Bacteroidota bacterium]